MTNLETQVLEILMQDCRTDASRMAIMLGVSEDEVKNAVKALEDKHIVLHYAPVVNWDHTDRNTVEALIKVNVTPQRDQGFDAIARRIYLFDEVKSVYLMSGDYDLLVLIEAPTLKELAFFVSEKLSTLDTVTGTATSFVLKRYKQDGVIFEEDARDRRLAVSP